MEQKEKESKDQKPKATKPPTKKFEIQVQFNMRNAMLWFLILLLFVPYFMSVISGNATDKLNISQLVNDVRDQKVQKIKVTGQDVQVEYKEGGKKFTRKEESQNLVEILKASDIDPASVDTEIVTPSFFTQFIGFFLNYILPALIVGMLILMLMRKQMGGSDGIFSIGKSRAKLFNKGKQDVKFADVGGLKEAKRELEEVVDFLKNPKKYRDVGARVPKGVLLVGPSGTGKCVTGDTMVWTNKGLMEIREVPRYYFVDSKSHKVYGANLGSFNVDKTISTRKFASHWYDLGEQETIRIQLRQGYELEGTPEHPIVVMTQDGELKFRKLADIQKGDQVAIQYGRQMFGDLSLADEDTAYLMGLLTGDGNLSHASRIGLTSVDKETISFFKKYVKTHYTKSAITVTKNKQSYLVANWDFKKYLYQMGMSYLLSFNKVIPPTILQAPALTQKAFLQGLFDTDASIYTKHAEFEYSTVSERMARQVHMMLLNFGIIASLVKKSHVSSRPSYGIRITGEGLKTFGKMIGFRLTRKQHLLETHLKRMVRVNTNIDVIPGIARILEESWKFLSVRKLSNEKMSKIIDKVRFRMRVSRNTLREYIEYATSLSIEIPKLEHLRSLLEANLFFTPVIEKAYGTQRVYDFTVPQTHSFLGNGFVNHNTMLARAVAGEANVPFLSMAGSEFMEMLVGVGASRARDLFETAKKVSPSIIFIDEIDAIGRMRGFGSMGGHDEREQTLNQILVEMDGFTQNDAVIVLAATNRGDLLDPALVRPGRFDRRVTLDLPDLEERKFILSIHAKNKPFMKSVDWDKVAKRTVGFSGADLENMLNESAILIAREDRKEITTKDIEEAALKVKLGPEKKKLQSDLERKMTAYHEGGHAVLAHFLPNTDPVHRVSIVSRGRALGFTMTPPEQDKYQQTQSELEEQIIVLLGGRTAEKQIFGELTGGASSDIERATHIARSMVVDYGMSPLGPMNFGPLYDMSDYGRAMNEPPRLSNDLQAKVDKEIMNVIERATTKAETMLKKYRKQLDAISNKLLEVETVESDEIDAIMGEKKMRNTLLS